jgi:raffinose/stachyose/melibiose transport system permease protein
LTWFHRDGIYECATTSKNCATQGLFDQVFILTGGGPGQASQTISTLMYRNAFLFGEFAYSTALAVLLTIFVSIFSAIQYFLISKIDKS